MERIKIETILIVALALLTLLSLYLSFSPNWDIIVHYLGGQAFANTSLYTTNWQPINTFQEPGLYIEVFRAPLIESIMAPMSVVLHDLTIPIYAILALALFVIAIKYSSKAFGIDSAIALAILLNPYVLDNLFLINGSEVLSMAMLLIGMAFVLRKKPVGGLFLALASLSKYPMVIFLPLVFLMREPKKIAVSIAIEAATWFPWLLFNYHFFGNPLYSPMQEAAIAVVNAPLAGLSPSVLSTILLVPVIFIVLAVLLLVYIKSNKARLPHLRLNPATILLLILLISTPIEFLLVSLHNDPATQIRYGYLMVLALLLAASYTITVESEVLDKMKKKVMNIHVSVTETVLLISIVMLLANLYIIYSYWGISSQYNLLNPNNTFAAAKQELSALGYSGCIVDSNAWPLVLYTGVTAYNPFMQKNYTILVFRYFGVNTMYVPGLSNASVVYNGTSFEILRPQGWACT